MATPMAAVAGGALLEPSWLSPTNTWLLHDCMGIDPIKFGLPALADMLVSFAPLIAVRQIQEERTTDRLPLLPYSTMYVCSSVWTAYGMLLANPGIWMASLPGVFMGLYYTRVFCQHCPKYADWLPGKQIHHVAGMVGATACLGTVVAVCPTETALFVTGLTGNILCVGLFSSPLAAIKVVLEQKNTRNLPFAFGLISFINCALFTVYGVAVLHDPFVWFPFGLGFASSVVQMALFARFGVYRYL